MHFGKALYGVALLGNSGLLIATVLLGGALGFHQFELASYCAAAACGLQNGMCTMHFGVVVRTTHVTGLATDLGVTLGRVASVFCKRRCRRSRFDAIDLAKIEVDTQKLHVYMLIGLGFISGVVFGAFIENYLGVLTLLIPASVTGLGGLAYTFFWAGFRNAEVSNQPPQVEEVHEILERTRYNLHLWQEETGADTTGNKAEDLDDQMSHALEVLNDLEASLATLYETDSHHSPSPSHRATNPKRHSPKSDGALCRVAERSDVEVAMVAERSDVDIDDNLSV